MAADSLPHEDHKKFSKSLNKVENLIQLFNVMSSQMKKQIEPKSLTTKQKRKTPEKYCKVIFLTGYINFPFNFFRRPQTNCRFGLLKKTSGKLNNVRMKGLIVLSAAQYSIIFSNIESILNFQFSSCYKTLYDHQ